jgi:hypothetical protein
MRLVSLMFIALIKTVMPPTQEYLNFAMLVNQVVIDEYIYYHIIVHKLVNARKQMYKIFHLLKTTFIELCICSVTEFRY